MALNHQMKMSFNATRDLLAKLVQNDANMLLSEHIILYDISFSNLHLEAAMEGKTLEVKAAFTSDTLNFPTVLKSKQVKVHAGNNDFATSGKSIYEGGNALEFQLCQTSMLFSATILASAQVSLHEIMKTTPKETTQEGVCIETVVKLQSVDSGKKFVGTLYVTLRIGEATLEKAVVYSALKVVKCDKPPSSVTTDNAKENLAFHKRATVVTEELDRIFDKHPEVLTQRKQARIDARLAREKGREKLSDADVKDVEACVEKEKSTKAGGYNPLTCCKAEPADAGTEVMEGGDW